MLTHFKRQLHSNKMQLTLLSVAVLAWLGFIAWVVAWPLTWLSIPLWLCLGYAVFRIIFELTLNRANVPTLATCFVARQKIAKILENEAARGDKKTYAVIDLGSGRGELARCVAKRIPKASVTGVELALFPYLQASFVQRWFGPNNLSYERGDFWSFDCTKADAVILYLGPLSVQRMGEKLHKELKQGSMVLSNTYPLLGKWSPIDVLNFYSPFKETFYVYTQRV